MIFSEDEYDQNSRGQENKRRPAVCRLALVAVVLYACLCLKFAPCRVLVCVCRTSPLVALVARALPINVFYS